METKNILTADFLDILFEGKNKAYGAYELRKTYQKRIGLSLAGMILASAFFIVGSSLASSARKPRAEVIIEDVLLENLKKEEKKPEEVIPPKQQEMPKVEMSRFTPPKIVIDAEVKPDEEIRDMEKMEDTRIGTMNMEGTKDPDLVAPPVEKSTHVVEAPSPDEDVDKIFVVVQIAAEFPGGQPAWIKYLERNLNRDLPSENGAPPAKYTVVVSFVVGKDGSISDVQAENDPGYGTRNEAIRVIQKGPKWKPAVQNGKNVNYRHKQSISFVVKDE